MRRWWIAGLVAVLVAGSLGYGAVRHFTSAGYIESKLSAMLASENGVNRVRIATVDFSPWRGSLAASDIEFSPDTVVVAQRIKAGKHPGTRSAITASSLRVQGIRFWPLMRGSIMADSAVVDGFHVNISVKRSLIPGSGRPPATMPHLLFQSLDRPIRIDAIRLTNSSLTYSEIARDGSRPGTIRFSDMSATISNLANKRARMTAETPCTIRVSTRINEAGRLDATFGYDLLSPPLSMTCRGNVSRMRADALNDLLVNLNGIKITSGVMDSTWFDFKLSGDVARGDVQVLYRDLDIVMLDKVTLEKDLMSRLMSFINEKTKMNHANPRDDETPATVVTVARERAPQTSLIKFLWETLREGILSTLGV